MAGQKNKQDSRFLFKPGYKVWLEKDEGVQGDGFFQLLEHIEQMGTIAAAAESMGMSYRAAWGKIKAAEKEWDIQLVATKVGGDTGGGTRLTPEAVDLLHRFLKFRREVDREMVNIYRRNFSD